MKMCVSCKQEKDEMEFNFKNTKTGLLQASCKACTREQSKRYYAKTVQQHITRTVKNRQKVANRFQEIKRTLTCTYCDESDSVCLDFHHTDPTKKEKSVASMVGATSWKRIMDEINKCIVVCKNCHAKIHAGRAPIK